jgi:DNA-binding NarL/FixJ family response regulator
MDYSKDTVAEDRLSVYQRQYTAPFNATHWSYLRKRFHMTERELQIAELACQGFSNDKIAKTLKIKLGTVKTHLRNIYRKIRVDSKIAMLLKFIKYADKFSAKSERMPAIPIVDVKNQTKKRSDKILKKDG